VGMFAAATGIIPNLVLLTTSALTVRSSFSIFLAFCVILSVEVIPILWDARQPREQHEGTLRESIEVLRIPAMVHATALRFWQGAADTTSLTFSVYYLTFVDDLTTQEGSRILFVTGALCALEELLLIPLWSLVWTKATERRGFVGRCLRVFRSILQRLVPSMRITCMTLHIVGAFLPPCLLRALPILRGSIRPWEYVVYMTLLRLCYSPQTFFRINAFCWTVDEDCNRGEGRRREAVFAGVVKCLEEEGRAVGFALFLGLGWSGLRTINCEGICENVLDQRSCVDTCEVTNIARQPTAVHDYVLAMLSYIVPCFGLLCAVHIWLFPIHGKRLADLQSQQARTFKNVWGAHSVPPDTLGAPAATPRPKPFLAGSSEDPRTGKVQEPFRSRSWMVDTGHQPVRPLERPATG